MIILEFNENEINSQSRKKKIWNNNVKYEVKTGTISWLAGTEHFAAAKHYLFLVSFIWESS